MPKITLFALNSSYTHTNLAVRCIRKSLTAAGFDCDIIEFSLKDKRRRVLEALVTSNADIYGFSAYIWNISEIYGFASDLKKLCPGAAIVFGGPEVSFDSEEILAAHPYIDCIIKGEGERAFCELARMWDAGSAIPPVIEGGIFEDFPMQGSVYGQGELQSGARLVYYESSRGCPFRCAYCLSALSGSVRAKNADTVLSELLEFESVGNIKVVKFVDRTFNFDRERAKEIWRGVLSEKYTKSYHFEICAELLDEESFDILSSFSKGKVQLEIGVQSVNSETLKRVCRKSDTDRLIQNIERLYKMGNMHIHADLIAGLPCETFESFARAFDTLYGKCHMLQLGFLKLLRGSKLRREAEDFGCVYSDAPPYAVLSTNTLSFADISLLHDIDELSERYGGGAFSRTMKLIMARTDSPFSVYLSLSRRFAADGIRIGELSQPKAYEKLYEYCAMGEDGELSECLILDFLTSQKLSPPKIGGHELVRCDDASKRDFMRFADGRGIEYFAPALEVRMGHRKYIVDRRNMRAFICSEGEFIEI